MKYSILYANFDIDFDIDFNLDLIDSCFFFGKRIGMIVLFAVQVNSA